MDVEWAAAPRRAGNPSRKYAEFFDELRKHPGQWAKWPGPQTGWVASNIRRGRYSGCRRGEFDVHQSGEQGILVSYPT